MNIPQGHIEFLIDLKHVMNLKYSVYIRFEPLLLPVFIFMIKFWQRKIRDRIIKNTTNIPDINFVRQTP